MPLFSSKHVPPRRSLIVLWNTFSIFVHVTQTGLGSGIPLFGKGSPLANSSCEITTFVSSKSLFEIPAPTGSRTCKKNGKG